MPGEKLLHRHGLMQGDPLSPLLFILAINPLHWLLAMAADKGILKPLPGRCVQMRASLYANEAIIFANPVMEEIDDLIDILQCFGDSTCLRFKLTKSSVAAVRCDNIDLDEGLQNFGGQTVYFPPNI
jgi:hypothetical protein